MKRIASIQDISCLGRCSLTVALPVISALGVECAIVPTAVLSAHTAFPGFVSRDLSDQLTAIAAHWRSQHVHFDALYTGYIASAAQVRQVLDFFDAVLPIDAEMYRNKKQKTTPESAKEALAALLPVLEAQADWNRDAIFEACKTLAEQMEKKNGWLLFPLGIALSGKARTPGGGTDLAAMMGKEETIVRVKAALEKL